MLDIQKFLGKPKIEYSNDNNIFTFKFGPLPAGLGHSIGNMIRRTIIAYTPAISITALNIDGITHEYSTIDGVKETTLQIMLNFKDLRFKGELPEKIQWVKKTFKGIGKYTAKDLDLPAGIELLTDNNYLFEITDPKQELTISYRLEKGYRYLSIDELKKREKEQMESDEGVQLGNLLIDNDFKLVKNINYTVQEVISDLTGDYSDILEISLETISEKIDAKELLAFAGEVVTSYTKMFIFDKSYIDSSLLTDLDELEDEVSTTSPDLQEVHRTPIDSLSGLSERTRNALIKNKIEFVEDLEIRTRPELISLKGIGKKAVDEIQEALAKEGKQLGTKK